MAKRSLKSILSIARASQNSQRPNSGTFEASWDYFRHQFSYDTKGLHSWLRIPLGRYYLLAVCRKNGPRNQLNKYINFSKEFNRNSWESYEWELCIPIKMGDFSSIIFITHIFSIHFLWNLSANRCLFSLISTFQKSLIGISGNPMYSA